jgi:two-component system chemotaxis response regulator CheB
MKAMALGAVECLVKPGAGEAKSGSAFHHSLLALIRSLCPQKVKPAPKKAAPLVHASPTTARNDQGFTLRAAAGLYAGRPEILAIGSSTGGPQALFEVLKHCTGLTIPIVITQHMPATFTKILAEHISRQTGLTAVEGESGMILENGKVYVAPGGFHMVFEKTRDGKTRIALDDGAPVNYCKPSVEPMLASLLALYGNKILGVILTGMGHDGLDGCKALSSSGGRVIAQDEASSVVWGMPGAVAMAGICNAVLPLAEIGPWVKKAASGLYTKPIQV